MGTKTRSQVSTDRQKWDKIFNDLVKMLQTQQGQLESLIKERKIFEDRIKMQHERWFADIRFYEDHISQMKNDLVAQEMARLLGDAKSNLLVGLKHRETSFCKLKLEHAEDELADFKAWFDFLTQIPKDITLKDSTNTCKEKAGGKDSNLNAVDRKMLESEARRLMLENEKLASEKCCEVSALLRENGFAWEQYRRLESELTNKLKSKGAEVEQANEKVSSLISCMEQLQSSNHEKDETIASLNNKVAELETDANKWNEENSRLSKELELLRKSRNASVTPVLKCCMAGASNLGGKNDRRGGSNVVVMKDLSAAKIPDPVKKTGKENRSLKRKGVDGMPTSEIPKESSSLKRKEVDGMWTSETPKLFTSNFKVPKLKILSPTVTL